LNKYQEVIYGNYPKSNYPRKLVNYLFRYIIDTKIYNILDVGCGDRTYVREFIKLGFNAKGIDNENLIYNKEKKTILKQKIDFNKDKLPYKNNFFDLIFNKSVIEHVYNTEYFLSEIYRILKPGGKVIIFTPSWSHNFKDFYNDPTHVKPFHRKGLQDALRLSRFENVKVEYFYHLPWLWNHPKRFPLVLLLRLFSRCKWKNKEENIHRPNIRFAQEVQLLGIAEKGE